MHPFSYQVGLGKPEAEKGLTERTIMQSERKPIVADADVDKRLSELFGELDRDGDGVLSLAEFTPLVKAIFLIEEAEEAVQEAYLEAVQQAFNLLETDVQSTNASDFAQYVSNGVMSEEGFRCVHIHMCIHIPALQTTYIPA